MFVTGNIAIVNQAMLTLDSFCAGTKTLRVRTSVHT